MSINYLIPLIIVIICNVSYHLISKSMPSTINPFIALVTTYGVSCLASLVAFFITCKSSFTEEISKINFMYVILGLVLVGIEAGYIYMYRSGWEVSKGSLVSNIMSSMVLLTVGALVFREELTLTKILGICVCILGIFLLNK